jgi:hypothetical protein
MTSKKAPWLMLFFRIILFAGIQAILAFALYLSGSTNAWDASAAWWPLTVTLTNLICVALLIRIFRAEGKRYWDIFRIERKHILGDLLVILGLFIIAGPVSYFPQPFAFKSAFRRPAEGASLIDASPSSLGGIYQHSHLPDHTGISRTPHLFWLRHAAFRIERHASVACRHAACADACLSAYCRAVAL